MTSKRQRELALRTQVPMFDASTNYSGERVAIVAAHEFPTFTPDDLHKLNGCKFTFDTETSGLQWHKDKVLGLGVYCPDVLTGYLPIGTVDLLQDVVRTLYTLNADTLAVAHNLKFDCHFLGLNPRKFSGSMRDTVVMAHLWDSRHRLHPKKLASLEKEHLYTQSKKAIAGELDFKKMSSYPPDLIATYCINDCRITYDLESVLLPKLSHLGLVPLLHKGARFASLLWNVEREGIFLDSEACHRSKQIILDDQVKLERQLFTGLGRELDWRNNGDLSYALYEGMGIERPVNPFAHADGIDRSKFALKGKYNTFMTDHMILLEKVHHPLGETVMNLRESDKITQYYDSFLRNTDAVGYVHTTFNDCGTRTGRLSSGGSNYPNFQNLASDVRARFTQTVYSGDAFIRSKAYNIRRVLLARPGHKLVSIDWRQMEMRMFGILAQESEMLTALRSGRDIHAEVGMMVWGNGDKVHREWSKTIGFGLIYGMTTGSLEWRLNMSHEEAETVTKQYWMRFPRIQPWIDETISQCKANGFIRYATGRIWREDYEPWMYKGANASIQGACSDVLSVAALRCEDWLLRKGYGRIINLVHDELDFEIPDEYVPEAVVALSHIMHVSDLFNIPFFTDAKVGDNFGEMYEWNSTL